MGDAVRHERKVDLVKVRMQWSRATFLTFFDQCGSGWKIEMRNIIESLDYEMKRELKFRSTIFLVSGRRQNTTGRGVAAAGRRAILDIMRRSAVDTRIRLKPVVSRRILVG
jgi:hypothetical protein